jgi:predicted dehydrogenase
MRGGEKVRIGVVGCGPIAQAAHFDGVTKAKNAELYAICDVAEDLLTGMAARWGPRKTFRDYDAMLEDDELEGVIIATADPFHIPLAKKAMRARKHVLVEKPIGTDIEEAEELLGELEGTDLVFQVGNMKRFDPGIAFAGDFIRRELGELISLSAWYCDSHYRYTMTDNLQPLILGSGHKKPIPGGNPKADKEVYYLLTHGVHLVNTAQFLGGPIDWVEARLLEKGGIYCWTITAAFRAGFFGQLNLTVAIRADWNEGFTLYGEGGSVFGKTYLPWFFKSSEVECFSARDRQYHRVLGEDAHFYKLEIEAFAGAILQGAPSPVSAAEGLWDLRVLAAIARSVREGGCRVWAKDTRGGVS